MRPLAISRDSPWSHAAWAGTLGSEGVPLLSDWNGDVTRAFGLAIEPLGMKDVAMRSSFLIEDGTSIVEAWTLGPELPDIDGIVAAARRHAGGA